MTIELMDGHTGEMHISSEDWTVFNTATYGVSGGVFAWGDSFKLAMTTSNKGTLGTGACLVDGKRVWIKTPEDVTVESGGQGVKRHDIVGIQYETYGDGLERAVVKTVKGAPSSSPADPGLPAKFLALWRVPLDGITVGEPVQMYKVVPRATDPVTTSRLAANAVTSDKLAPAVRDSISRDWFTGQEIDNAFWAPPGVSTIAPDTTGGTGAFATLVCMQNDNYASNPSMPGAWCHQVAYITDGTVKRRYRVNGNEWSSWA